MINFIYGYIIFCLATGVAGYFTLYKPTLKRLEAEYGLELEDQFIGGVKFIIASSLAAPIVFIQTLLGCTDEYLEKLIETIEEDEED